MGEILDHIEGRVNSAKQLLENIRDVSSLGNVEDCLSELNALSRDLY